VVKWFNPTKAMDLFSRKAAATTHQTSDRHEAHCACQRR
jgi:hypothetical protein